LSLEQDFQDHILEQHQIGARETKYKASLFKPMVLKKGALQAAKDLLVGPTTISEGLTRLVLHRRLDLSLEANVIKPEWRSLFDKNELTTAVERLTSLELPVGPDIKNYLSSSNKPGILPHHKILAHDCVLFERYKQEHPG
jgi:putative restriction endonuclease